MEQHFIDGPKCPVHGRLLEYFCTDDEQEICSRCYIMGEHKDHAIVSFEEKNKTVISSLENGIEAATVVYNKLSQINKRSLENKLKAERANLFERVTSSFINLRSVLRRRESEILDQISSVYQNNLLLAEETIQNAKNEKLKLEKALADSRMLLENQAHVVDGENLLKIIGSAPHIPCILSKGSSLMSNLKWNDMHMDDIADAINSFGTIIDEGKILDNCLQTIEESPEEIKDEDRVLRWPLTTQKSHDACSISSIDTGEDVIIESDDTESVVSISSRSSVSSRGSVPKDIVVPQIKGACKQVNVTHISSPNDFYIQLVVNKNKLENLSRNINSWCRKKSSAHRVPVQVVKGMLVLACYSEDKQWYRARVINVMSEDGGDGSVKAHVMYYDFGNEEIVSVKNLRNMERRFEQYPPFCMQCSLFDTQPFDNTGQWDKKSVQEFYRITNNQILLLNTLAIKGFIYEVDLICIPTEGVIDDKFSSVRDMLIFLGLAKFAKPNQPNLVSNKPGAKGIKSVDFFQPTTLASGETVEMTVSEAVSPSDFYIMPKGDEYMYYLEMMEEMQDRYNNDAKGLYTMHCPRKDSLCAVKGLDSKWHRGKIISGPKNANLTVYLTDRGSSVVVPLDKIKKLLSDFIKLPSQAIHCRMADIGLADGTPGEWCDDVKGWCSANLKGSAGTVRIVRWGEPTEVVLWLDVNLPSINSYLVATGLAVSTGLASIPTAASEISIGANSKPPVDIKVHENSDSNAKKNPRKVSPNKKSKGTASPTTSNSTPPSVEKSATASSKSSSKSPPKKSKSKSKTEKSESKTSRRTDGDSVKLDLNRYAQDVESARKKRVQENICKAMDAASGEGEKDGKTKEGSTYIEIIVGCYKSPTDFFIRVQEREAALQELMQELNSEYKESVANDEQKWQLEDFCVVRYPGDKRWYRGKINVITSPTEVEVELLDYGDTIAVSHTELRPLTPDLGTRMQRAAIRCHLANLIPTGTGDRNKWSHTATDFMASIISSKKLYIKAEGDLSDSGLPIDIIVEEEIPETAFDPVTYTYSSLQQKIVEQGLAIFDKSRKRTTTSTSSVEKMESSSEKESSSSKEPDVFEVPPYAIPTLNEEIQVLPTFIDFSGVIYAQRADWNDEVAHLSEELQRVYQDSRECQRTWSLGQMCVALFNDDGMWYRGLIEELDKNLAKIFYIDFGNSAWVNVTSLREMKSPFAKYHVQVYHCVLEDLLPNTQDGVWPVALLDIIHEMVVNCKCTMVYTGMMDNGHLKIKLQKPDGFDLATYLIEGGYAVSTMDLKDRFAVSKSIGGILSSCALCTKLDVGGVGSIFAAITTEVELPNIIYLQRMRFDEVDIHDFVRASEIAEINSQVDDFERMMVDISTTPSSGFIKLPDVGMICLGQYSFDENFYRAVCVENYPEHDSCLMVFIDYGTSEIVPRNCLRMLPSQFWDLPSQGIRCHLNLLPPGHPTGIWRKNSLDAMVQALAEKQLVVKVVRENPLTVELFVETEDRLSLAYEEVIQKGLACLPMEVNMNELLGQAYKDDVEVEEVETGIKLGMIEDCSSDVNMSANAGLQSSSDENTVMLEQQMNEMGIIDNDRLEKKGLECEKKEIPIGDGKKDDDDDSDDEDDCWTTDSDDDEDENVEAVSEKTSN